MKKVLYIVFCSLFSSLFVTSQAQTHFSASAQQLAKKLKQAPAAKLTNLDELDKEVFLIQKDKNGGYFVRGLISVFPEQLKKTDLEALDIQVKSTWGSIWSIEVPLNSFIAFAQLQGIHFFEMDQYAFPQLDKARTESGVDKVHNGNELPQPYTGKGVIAGVVDIGFDYNHQTFLDSNGEQNRIVRLWEQFKTMGTPPTGFSYGAEYKDKNDIFNRKRDTTVSTHGTHVAGIMAGSGYGTNGTYKGVAPDADLAIVSSSFTYTTITEGVDYLIKYAQSVGKPIVVNMSIGGFNERTMDGTSLHDKAIENMVNSNAGIAVVASAGNSGDDELHYEKEFANDTIYSVLAMSDSIRFYTNTGKMMGKVNIVGEVGKDFSVCIKVGRNNGQIIGTLPFTSVLSNANHDTLLVMGNDSLYFRINTWAAYPTNNRPRYELYIHNITRKYVAIGVTAPSGKVHIWNVGQVQGAPLRNQFPNTQPLPGYVKGDTRYTVGEPGSSKGVITVGAHTTKNTYTDIHQNDYFIPFYAELGAIAPFSSFGPTVDGRTKPELSASGNVIVSAVSAHDNFLPDNYKVDVSMFPENLSQYAAFQGTSMSSPMVAGVVALMFEANPGLSFQQIRQILIETAAQDNFTGTLPDTGDPSYRWGWGKLNAHAALKRAATTIGIDKPLYANTWHIYPNPTQEHLFIEWFNLNLQPTHITITDAVGKTIYTRAINTQEQHNTRIEMNTEMLPQGLYFVQIQTPQGNIVRKFIKS